MPMNELITLTIKEIGGAVAVLSALFIWLGNVWKDKIHLQEKHKFDIKLKELEASHSLRTQQLEHELQIERHAVQLGHAKLIEKRAALIDESYKLLVELHDSIYDTIRPDYFGRQKPSKQKAYESSLPKFDVFVEHFEKNKIYFSKDTAEKISEFYVAAAQTLAQAKIAIQPSESPGGGDTEKLQKLFESVNYEMGKARGAIEHDFRVILKVNQV